MRIMMTQSLMMKIKRMKLIINMRLLEYNEEDATKNRKTSDENAEDDNIKDIKSDEEKDVEHVDNHNENSNEEIVKEEDTHTSSHKTEYQVETETEDDTFLQEAIVNNFRPVQPLNDRVVYRNFKLRPPINIVDHAPTHSHHAQSRQEDSEDDGSTYHKLSLSAIVVVLIVTVVFV
uniref:Uncharacterized protein n=1 Tax=Arion vulgaris TaxID=1028688 RepID=A0A0B7A0B0_9EUPU